MRLGRLLRQHLLDLLVTDVDLDDGITALVERGVFKVAHGWQEDFGIPDEALSPLEVGHLVAPCEWRGSSTAL